MSTGSGAAKSSDICSVGLNISASRLRRSLLRNVAGFPAFGFALAAGDLLDCCFLAGSFGVGSSLGSAACVVPRAAVVKRPMQRSEAENVDWRDCIRCYSA